MQSLNFAFRFINACFSLALKHKRLRNPWLILWMGGVAILVLGMIPFVAVIILVGMTQLSVALIGLFSILLLFAVLAWGEVSASETCQAFFYTLNQAEEIAPETEIPGPEFVRWKDVFMWFLIQPGLAVIRLFKKIFQGEKGNQEAWLTASYLTVPVIRIENLSQVEAVERVKQIFKDHLLRVHLDLVGVRPVAGMIQWLFILVGGVLGLWVGRIIADPVTGGVLSRMLGIALGILLAGVLALLGIFFSSFTRACYYTSLYQWVLNVESARRSGETSQGAPPAILSRVMGKPKPNKKE